MSVLVIIPVYKNYEQRDRCLAALAKQTMAVDTFIHDNTTENIGYTKAVNRGLRDAIKRGHRFALILNQDCYPEPDAVEKLIRFMDEHPRCALAGPMQLSTESSDDIVNAGGTRAFPFGVHRAGKRSVGWFASAEQISWVNGACMFARMDAVIEFGLMDETMFLIGSDSDWSFTARVRGWECWYCPAAIVLHEGGVTQSWPSADVTRIFHNDMSHWRRKWVGTVFHRQLDRSINPPPIAGPLAVAAAVQQGIDAHTGGRLVDAEVLYRDVLQVDPQNADALNLLGVIELQYGMAMTAHDLFRRAVAVQPQTAQFHTHLATSLATLNRGEEAIVEYLEGVRLEARSAPVLEAIAQELTRLGRPQDAATARAKAKAIQQAK